jgi:hypothetical protein
MKVYELLTEAKKREKKLDTKALRADYLRWKKLVNMPQSLLKAVAGDKDAAKAGLTARELKTKMHLLMPKSAAKAILRMRATAVAQWTTVEVNWMYRMLKYIDQKVKNKSPYVSDGKPTEKLKNLWAFGHVPGNLRPGKTLKEEEE